MENQNQAPAPRERTGSFIWDLIKFALIAIIIVIPLRLFVAQPFIVSGSSMEPTFFTNQYLIVDELTYHFVPVSRGDVIIFKYPVDTTKYFIKRVIGLPGETVQIVGTKVFIKNAANPNGFELTEDYVSPADEKDDNLTTTLGPGEYFVMGDNRYASYDSRAWGPVPANDIIGRPVVRLFPLNTFGFMPGEALVKNR